MWAGEAFLFHSCLSAAMSLKLLDPREVLRGAETAWRSGAAPIESVEGFVRQSLGWREYVRGVCWLRMPEYLSENALGAVRPLPPFYRTGETEKACLANVLGQTLDPGCAHHIQRLMVTGLYALLLGVRPVEVHRWYLAVCVDAVEWVEVSNVIGITGRSRNRSSSGRAHRLPKRRKLARIGVSRLESPGATPARRVT